MTRKMQHTARNFCPPRMTAIFVGVGLSLFAAAMPASAQTIYDVDIASKMTDVSPQVRAQIRSIAAASRVQMMAVLEKYGIDPKAKPDMDKLMQASDELQAVQHAQRDAIAKLVRPEDMADYNNAIAATSQRIRDAAK